MMSTWGKWAGATLVVTLAAAMERAEAVPYASSVRNTSGSIWEFVLNEPADNVTVLRDGGNPVNLGAINAGRHTFNMTGFSTFAIEVANSAAAGWTPISDPNNLFTNFTIPSGVAINKDPSSQYFGTVYVASANPATSVRGRTMGEGIYSLTADMIGVDLANNFAPVANANDPTLAKSPGFNSSGSASASPWRLTLDEAGNVIIADWSDPAGGLKYAAPNLATGGLILSPEGDTDFNHGSIAAKPYVTGSVGNNLVVHAMDEDQSPFNTIWEWQVGNETNYTGSPTRAVIDSAGLDAVSSWISTVISVRAGAHYSPQHDKWYMVQNRDDGNQAGIFVVEDPDMDGFPDLLWDSLGFTNDPNGDMDPSDALDGHTGLAGVQDVFRNIGDVTVSDDGTKLIVHRIAARGTANPHVPGAVMIIPLDANGVPAIEVSGGVITNVETITTPGNDLAHSSGAQVEFDAAGNLYVANSGVLAGNPSGSGQLVQVYSPGGNTKAITTSSGMFTVEELAAVADADFNNDGTVDGADFLTWQRGLGPGTDATGDATGDGQVNGADLAQWASKFGGPPAEAAGNAVPEPAGATLALALGLAGLAASRRR